MKNSDYKTNFRIGIGADGESDTISSTSTDNPFVPYEDKEKVNHPSHYNFAKKETIKIIEEYCTDDEYRGFLKGNILKYVHRYQHKNGLEDLNKAKWYLEELIRIESSLNKN